MKRRRFSLDVRPGAVALLAGLLRRSTAELSGQILFEGRDLLQCPREELRKVQGREIGITAEERMGYYGTYYALSFDRSAQQFIFDNLEAIVGSDARTATLRGSLWTEEQDRTLTELFEKGMRIEEIAKEMKRTKGGVFRRLKEKGLLPDGPERPGNE